MMKIDIDSIEVTQDKEDDSKINVTYDIWIPPYTMTLDDLEEK